MDPRRTADLGLEDQDGRAGGALSLQRMNDQATSSDVGFDGWPFITTHGLFFSLEKLAARIEFDFEVRRGRRLARAEVCRLRI